jgi:hypothetical protein
MNSRFLFALEEWLWALPLLILLGIVVWRYSQRTARKRIALFLSPRLAEEMMASIHWGRKQARFWAGIAVMAAMVVALARPLTGPRPDRAERKGVDFIVALDVSKSMWTEDVAPNRLEAVKTELSDWLTTLNGDRMGLILFTSVAFVQAPVTFDYDALNLVLKEAGPKSISIGSTNIQKAIEMSLPMFREKDVDSRVLIIVSDGEGLEGDAIAAARAAYANDHVILFTIGVGTLEGGKVPNNDYSRFADYPPEKQPRRGYIRNEYGVDAYSRLDERGLRAIASAAGGRYYEFKPGARTFQTIYTQSLMPLMRQSKNLNVREYYEWFQLPVGLAILLLIAVPLIATARRPYTAEGVGVAVVKPENYTEATTAPKTADAIPPASSKGTAPVSLPLLFLALTFALPFTAHCAVEKSPIDQADQLLAAGKKAEAVELMSAAVRKNDGDLYLYYNYGLTLYRAGRFQEALPVFEAVQKNSTDSELQSLAVLQLGNAQYRLAQSLGQTSGAALSMERALGYFESLAQTRSSKAAQNNRQAAKVQLIGILTKIGQDRIKQGDAFSAKQQLMEEERFLREALQAYERIHELNPDDPDVVQTIETIKKKLVENLSRQAQKTAASADELQKQFETGQAPKDKKDTKEIIGRRQQSVAKYDEALQVDPTNTDVQNARQEQLAKMADQLANEAEKQAAPLLQKPTLKGEERKTLEAVSSKLDQARTLDSSNQKAQDLSQQVSQKLEDSYTSDGQKSLASAETKKDAQGQFDAVNSAAQNFQKALQYNPQSQPAQEGLKQTQDKIPDLYAAVAKAEMDKAQAQLNPAKKDAKAASPSTQDLQKAIGSLEKASQNFSAAVSLKPDNDNFKDGLQQAQGMLSQTREQLDKAMHPNRSGDKPGAIADPTAQPSGDSDQEAEYKGGQMESMNKLRPGVVAPKTTDNFWQNKVRDW